MRRTTGLAVVSVVLLCGAGVILAGSPPKPIWVNLDLELGEAYRHRDHIAQYEVEVFPMPQPVDPTPTNGKAFAQQGPVSSAANGLQSFSKAGLSVGAGALLAPRGAGFSSPRQRADREIRRMIRRID